MMFEETYLFVMSEKEEKVANSWKKEHNKTCKNILYTYSFTPNGIGTDVEVKCSCGKTINVTDISVW